MDAIVEVRQLMFVAHGGSPLRTGPVVIAVRPVAVVVLQELLILPLRSCSSTTRRTST